MNLVSLALAGLATPFAAAQTTWYVDAGATAPGNGSQSSPFVSIQAAIAQTATQHGDTVSVAPGTYPESLDFLGKAIVVFADVGSPPGAARVVITPPTGSKAVAFQTNEGPSSVLRDVDLVGNPNPGFPQLGGLAIVLDASPRFERVRFEGGYARRGGGVGIDGGSPTFDDCTFTANEGFDEGSGLYVDDGDVTIVGGSFSQNVEGYRGLGIAVGANGALAVDGTEFVGNRVSDTCFGGAIHMASGSTGTVQSALMENNGGGFNSGTMGGAIYAPSATLLVSNTVLEANGGTDTSPEGGAAVGGTFVDCTFTQNGAQAGGAISRASATGCLFRGNVACAESTGFGGAAWESQLTDCVLIANRACNEGGGAANSTRNGCVVESNASLNTCDGGLAGLGGGLSNCSAFDCVITDNAIFDTSCFPDLGQGGGVFGGQTERCIIARNSAPIGGGVSFGVHSQATIVLNEATERGAGVDGGAIHSSIVWYNVGASELSGGPTFDHSSLTISVPGVGNITSPPALLSPAAGDFGLSPFSPCIDTADPALPLDPNGSRSDMGAIAFVPGSMPTPQVYCRHSLPSPTHSVQVTGTASIGSGSTSVFTATGLPAAQFGLLAVSAAPADTTLFGTGLRLCLAFPIVRRTVQMTGGAGTVMQTIDSATLGALGAEVGSHVYAQFWVRVPTSPVGAGLSDAIEIPVLP